MKTCKKCGSSEHYKDGRCKPCIKAYNKKYCAENADAAIARSLKWAKENPEKANINGSKYRARHPEKEKARSKKYWEANKESINLRTAKWAVDNPEKRRASALRMQLENPESHRLAEHNRRARKRASGGILSKGLSDKLFKLQKGLCVCCKQPLGDNYHLDHIMPLAKGGSNNDDNMQLLRATCNHQKSSKHPIDFMRSRGFLL